MTGQGMDRRLPAGLIRAAVLLACLLGLPATAGASVLLPTGRTASPAGTLTTLRAYPTGAAVSPDGQTVLTIAGSLLTSGTGNQAPGAGVELYAVDRATGAVRQVIDDGDAFQSVVYSGDGRRAFVAGATSDAVHVLDVGPGGLLTKDTDFPVAGFVAGIALSPDGHTLWVAAPEAGKVYELDSASGKVLRTVTAPSPSALAVSRDGSSVYATDWRGSTVSRIEVATGAVTPIAVGDHPAAIARAADGRIVVADANDATLASIDPVTGAVTMTSLSQIGHGSDSPNAIASTPGGRIYVSLGGDNAIAVLTPRAGGHWRLRGLIPTGWYPDAVAVDPAGRFLAVVSARGLGHSAAATNPFLSLDPASIAPDSAYATFGTLQTLAAPGGGSLRSDSAVARGELAPTAGDRGSVVYAGARGPIKHIIYITRENKTYDADLGDLHPGPDNAFVLFGQPVTPNLHALERDFSEAQSFSYPSYVSLTGHMWEDAGMVSDIEDRSDGEGSLNASWHQPTNYPSSGLLVEQALRAGLPIRTYNEELAQQSGLVPPQYQASTSVYPNYDLRVSDTSREAGWETEFKQFEAHDCTGALAATYGAACSLPSLEYVYLGEDHTTVVDEPGYPSIQAQVADNDYATGKLIDTVSHSPDWASTLVIVVEDDPQGTGDRSSAYHGFIAIASPWIKRGYVSTVPYNLTSVVGAIDRLLGLPPITDYAATNRPLDDLFTSVPNCAPYNVDASGESLFPFTPFPGVPAVADRAHGVTAFAAPDHTIPAITNLATERELLRSHALGSFANPATFTAARAAAAQTTHPFVACPGA